MSPFWGRLLRRCLLVGVVLGLIGYGMGEAFLTAHRIYSAGAYNPENERVLWQTPLGMAGIGVLLTAGMELLVERFRKPAAVKAQTPPSYPESGS